MSQQHGETVHDRVANKCLKNVRRVKGQES